MVRGAGMGTKGEEGEADGRQIRVDKFASLPFIEAPNSFHTFFENGLDFEKGGLNWGKGGERGTNSLHRTPSSSRFCCNRGGWGRTEERKFRPSFPSSPIYSLSFANNAMALPSLSDGRVLGWAFFCPDVSESLFVWAPPPRAKKGRRELSRRIHSGVVFPRNRTKRRHAIPLYFQCGKQFRNRS